MNEEESGRMEGVGCNKIPPPLLKKRKTGPSFQGLSPPSLSTPKTSCLLLCLFLGEERTRTRTKGGKQQKIQTCSSGQPKKSVETMAGYSIGTDEDERKNLNKPDGYKSSNR
jgi:hypothetical protein